MKRSENTVLQKPETWCALTQSTSITHLHIQHHPIHLHLMLPRHQSVREHVVIVAIVAIVVIIREPVITEKINR